MLLAPLILAMVQTPAAGPVTSCTPAVEEVARDLEVPWALDFAPDGRLFVTERPGRIRVVRDGRLEPEPWATLDVVLVEDSGLRGLAIAPDFAATGHVYVLATVRGPGGVPVSRVIRYRDRNGRGTEPTVIVDDLPADGVHRGGALAFGPDGMLYVTTGDVQRIHDPSPAPQDPRSLVGKILRYRPDGTIPDDNPIAGSPVYALGVRNPQGLAWAPGSGALFATDHGPTGFPGERDREDEDELNAVIPAGNYGWPLVSGLERRTGTRPPVTEWTPGIAPSGLAAVGGRPVVLYAGALHGTHLRRIELEPDSSSESGWRVLREDRLLDGCLGRIRAVRSSPDGWLYLTTSNRTERSSRPGDDRIVRLRLRRDSTGD